MDERRGTIFAGRYRLERRLGSGGMADVWLAEDQELGRKVAIKILHERYANDVQFVERFRREATHAAGLSHPNVVAIHDRGEAEGSYFIVMEYVEGRTLKELIVTRGMCPIPVAISYARQVLAALRYAHRNGIVHRDIKPHNVLVDNEGRVKVADFGIARAGSSQMTEAGSIIGTAQYLSPEQARGAPVDESSDLYSTGIVLYELLTGKVPFTGETPVEIAMKHLSQIPEAPSTHRPEIPRDLDLVVLRALAKEPAERYRSAKEMDRDLELVGRGEAVVPETEEAATMVLRGETTAATAVAPPVRPAGVGGDERYRSYDGEVRRGRSWWPWLIALGAAIAVSIGALAVLRQRARPDRRQRAGRRRRLQGHPRAEVRGVDRRRRLRPQRAPPAERRRPEGLRVRAGARRRLATAEGQHGHDPRLERQEERERAVARRQVAGHGGEGADEPRARRRRPRGAVRQAVRHRHRAGSTPGQDRRRGRLCAGQRVERAEAGGGSCGDRADIRHGRRAAAGGGLHGRPRRRREQSTGRRGRRPGSARQLDRLARLFRDALRLPGPEDHDRPRRLAAERRRRARDVACSRLQVERDPSRRRTTRRSTGS